ncbi:hypothetical protein GX586_06825 [bacterium]|nr:hypothetical protein [bacterium]
MARGYTLAEFLIASVATSAVLLALVAVYIHGYTIMRSSCARTWAQQRMNASLERIADAVRPAENVFLYQAYGPGGTPTNFGNCLFTISGKASNRVYRAGSTLYYVPVASHDSLNTSTDDVVLATSLATDTTFRMSNGAVMVTIRIMDGTFTNRQLIGTVTSFSQRN